MTDKNLNLAKSALRLVVTYDDLMRRYTGPVSDLTPADNAAIDEAYDQMVAAARITLDVTARATPAPQEHVQASDDALLKAVMQAIVSCGHEIDHDSVVLKFSSKQEGHNAYSQLSARVKKALEAHPAPVANVTPDAAARLERILRLGRSMKWTPHGAPALDDENTAVALGELFQIFFQDAVDRALATTEGKDNGNF